MPSLGSATFHLRTDAAGFHAPLAAAEAHASKATKSIGASMMSTGRKISSVGSVMSRRLTLPILGVAGASTKMAFDFDKSMTNIDALVGASDAQMGRYRQGVLDLAKAGKGGPQELAKALYFVTSSGFEGEAAMRVLTASATAAEAGLGNVEGIANLVTSAVNVYGEKTLSASQATDILTAAVREGKAEPEELANSMGRIIPVAEAMGVGFGEAAGATAALTLGGLDANEATTALRAGLMAAFKPTVQATKALKEVGLSTEEFRQSIANKGLLPTLVDLNKRFDGNSEAMGAVFGNVRGLVGALNLAGTRSAANATLIDRVTNSVGDTARAFEEAGRSPSKQFNDSMNALKASAIQLGSVLLPFVAQLANAISRAALAFTNLPEGMQKAILIGALVIAALGPIVTVVGTIITVAGALASVFGVLGVTIGAVAIPGAVVVAVLAAVGIALYLLWTRSETFRAVVTAAFDYVKAAARDLWAAAQPMFAAFGALVGTVAGLIRTHSASIGAAFRTVAQVLGTILRPAVDMIVNVIKIGMALITGIVKTATALLRGDWTGAWNAIKATVSQVWPLIKAAVAAGIAAIKAIIVAAAGAYKAVLSAAWSAIKAAASAAWNALPGVISAAWGAIKAATTAAVSAVIGFVRSGFAKLPGLVTTALSKIPGLLSSAASAAGAAAVQIGTRIVSGIMSGLGGIAGKMKGYLEGQLKGALSSLNPFSPVEEGGKKYIGDPIALGAMKGLILGFRDLPDKVSDRVKAIVEAGKKAVDSSRGRITSAFQRMGELVMRAFDKATESGLEKIKDKFDERLSRLTAEFQTPTEKLIEKMEDERQQTQLEDSVKEASDALAKAQEDAVRGSTGSSTVGEEGETPEERAKQQQQANEAVLNAQRQLQEAQYALNMRGLQAKAAAERLAEEQRRAGEVMMIEHKIAVATREYEAQREIQRHHLSEQMAALESGLANQGMTVGAANKKVKELMREHGLAMKPMGELMGESFAKGLRDSQKEVAKSAAALAKVVQRYLKLHSPADEGPLSDLDKWWKPFAPTIVASVDTRRVEGVASAIARSALGPVPTGRSAAALAAYSQGAAGQGPGTIEKLVSVEGDLVVRREEDADSVASMLSRKIVTARVAG
jgi:TP901 family phage tail tape measure protein